MKTSSVIQVSIVIGLLAIPFSGWAQTSTATGRSILLERVGSGKEVLAPKWENSSFLTFDIPDGGKAPSVYLLDRNGRNLRTVSIVIPDSIETGLTDVSMSALGELAISGGVTDSLGRSTGFIAFVGAQGKIRRIVRTAPFTARHIAFASDGSLWAAGWDLDESGVEKPEYDVLRHYGTDGVFIESALSRRTFVLSNHSDPISESHLVSSGGLVGIYSVNAREWIEVSSSTGKIIGRWPGPKKDHGDRVRGAVLTESGLVYLATNTSGTIGFTVYRLSRNNGTWESINGMSGRLLGAEGDMLLSQRASTISWIRAE